MEEAKARLQWSEQGRGDAKAKKHSRLLQGARVKSGLLQEQLLEEEMGSRWKHRGVREGLEEVTFICTGYGMMGRVPQGGGICKDGL